MHAIVLLYYCTIVRELCRSFFVHSSLRRSTSGPCALHDSHDLKISIHSKEDACSLIEHWDGSEKQLLLKALQESAENGPPSDATCTVSSKYLRAIFFVNTLSFVGFGLLDNMVMILAGEYLDATIGFYMVISTMAAAALGNIISDVAGVGLAHNVEYFVLKCGVKAPALASNQMVMTSVRYTANFGRAFGLVIGCFIGMFPLLFFDKEEEKQQKQKLTQQ